MSRKSQLQQAIDELYARIDQHEEAIEDILRSIEIMEQQRDGQQAKKEPVAPVTPVTP